MAGTYTPKTGQYAGQSFPSYRQYLNRKSQDEGFANFSQRTQARKVQRDILNTIDVSLDETKQRQDITIDIYVSDNLDEIMKYASTLAPNYAIRIIIDTDKSLGSSKQQRFERGWSTVYPTTKVSLYKKEYASGTAMRRILEEIDKSDIEYIYGVKLWVYR